MEPEPTTCEACGEEVLPRADEEGTQSRGAVTPCRHSEETCSVCGGLDREKATRLQLRLGRAPWPEDVTWLLRRLDAARALRRGAEADRDRLREALARAAVHLEILTGRMRGCHVETGRHELLGEAEAFCEEAREALEGKGAEDA